MLLVLPRLTIKNILWLALVLRIIAAVFSRGYGWYDDHFGVIELAQNWIDGINGAELLPNASGVQNDVRQLSLFYPGIHYFLFKIMNFCGIVNPQIKMLLIRLLHALYSLLVVYYGYKITKKLSDEKCALIVGLLLAALWFMPNLSVRNLIEMVCVPPLLIGCWWLMKDNDRWGNFLIAGFIAAFAFSIRYQSALFIAGMGLVLLLDKKWKGAFLFGIGVVLNVLLFQGITDCIFWGYPLAKFFAYVKYNSIHKDAFTTGYWFNYILLVAGMLIPPLGIMLWYGYFKNIRKHLILFLPSFIFLVFHCYFQNKQERFILPFIPFFIIVGTLGWYNFQKSSVYWSQRRLLINKMILFVAVVNCILLSVFTVASTKTSKMDSMSYIRSQGDVTAYIVEATDQSSWEQFPQFYLGKKSEEYILKSDYSATQLKNDLQHANEQPNYVIFLSNTDLDSRIAKFKSDYSNIKYLATIRPSFIDRLFYWLNPINRNTECYIYKIEH